MAQKKSTIASQGLSFRKCFRFEVNPAAAVEPLWCAPWTPLCWGNLLCLSSIHSFAPFASFPSGLEDFNKSPLY